MVNFLLTLYNRNQDNMTLKDPSSFGDYVVHYRNRPIRNIISNIPFATFFMKCMLDHDDSSVWTEEKRHTEVNRV